MRRDVYSGWVRLNGEEHEDTLIGQEMPDNYAAPPLSLQD